MAFAGKTNTLLYARNFEEAQEIFNDTPRPRGKDWEAHQRPLGDKRQWHYRIEQCTHGYAAVLYHTAMAMFFAPKPDGSRTVLYHGQDSMTSCGFRRDVLQICGRGWTEDYVTDEGCTVTVPIKGGYGVCYDMDPYGQRWAAKLVFNAEGKLVVSESDHAQILRVVLSDEDRERRAAVRKRLQDAVLLAALRLPQYKENATVDTYGKGRPFLGAHASLKQCEALRLVAGMRQEEPQPADYDAFFNFGQEVFDVLVSKRVRSACASSYERATRRSEWEGGVIAAVTEADFIRSLQAAVMRAVGANHPTGTEPLPKFMLADAFPTDAKKLRWG